MPSLKIPTQQNSNPQLGVFQRDFRVVKHKLKRDLRIGVGLLLIIIAVIAFGIGVYTSWITVRLHGRAALLQTVPLPLLIFLLGLLLGIVLLHYTRRHWHDRVSLYENGLILQSGKNTTTWLWQTTSYFSPDISVLKFGTSIIGEKYRLILEDDDGQQMIIPGRYADMVTLVEQIRNSLLPQMYTASIATMLKGESIPFAPELNAVLKGLIIKDDLCRWASLNPPQVVKNQLKLSRIGDNKVVYKTPIKQVKNLDLLLTLFENPPTG